MPYVVLLGDWPTMGETKRVIDHRDIDGEKRPLVILELVGDDLDELKITPAQKPDKSGPVKVSIRWGIGFLNVTNDEVIVARSSVIIHDLTFAGKKPDKGARVVVAYSPRGISFEAEDGLAFLSQPLPPVTPPKPLGQPRPQKKA